MIAHGMHTISTLIVATVVFRILCHPLKNKNKKNNRWLVMTCTSGGRVYEREEDWFLLMLCKQKGLYHANKKKGGGGGSERESLNKTIFIYSTFVKLWIKQIVCLDSTCIDQWYTIHTQSRMDETLNSKTDAKILNTTVFRSANEIYIGIACFSYLCSLHSWLQFSEHWRQD